MKKILHIISSPRGAASMSIKLGNAIVDKIKAEYPGSTVKDVNLSKINFPHIEDEHIAAFYTPVESLTAENKETLKYSDNAIQELNDADIIVIGALLYNFGTPSTLKAWIDQIVRKGITFDYGESGPIGLVKGKKVYIAFSAGGIYSTGPMESYDFVTPYIKILVQCIGYDGCNGVQD